MKKKKFSTVSLCILGMLTAISVVLVAFVHIPLVPAAPFLQYDMADVPILIATLAFGILPGLAVLFVTSAIQAFFFGGDGWIGLVMHFVASGAMVVIIGSLCKNKKSIGRLVPVMLLGAAAMVAVMIPMNLLLTPIYLGTPIEAVKELLVPAIIPFNALKAVLNCILAALVYKAISPVLEKYAGHELAIKERIIR